MSTDVQSPFHHMSSGMKHGPGGSIAPQMRKRVCRNLFGIVPDHEENKRFIQEELQKLCDQGRQIWNFDFASETPLPGRYEWTPVLPTEKVHASYGLLKMPYLGSHPACTKQEEPEAEKASHRPPIPESEASSREVPSEKATESKPRKLRQSCISEFMSGRKRRAVMISKQSPNSPPKQAKVQRTKS